MQPWEQVQEAYKKIKGNTYWRHYKGGIYKVEQLGYDATSDEPCVLYYRIDDGPGYDDVLYSRLISDWFEKVHDVDGNLVPRFLHVQKVERWEPVPWKDKRL